MPYHILFAPGAVAAAHQSRLTTLLTPFLTPGEGVSVASNFHDASRALCALNYHPCYSALTGVLTIRTADGHLVADLFAPEVTEDTPETPVPAALHDWLLAERTRYTGRPKENCGGGGTGCGQCADCAPMPWEGDEQ